MRVFAIDPGSYMSAWVFVSVSSMNGLTFISRGKENNADVLKALYLAAELEAKQDDCATFAIEEIQSYGARVGAETFDSCVWIGRYYQAVVDRCSKQPLLVTRPRIKSHHCGHATANDGQVRQAIIDKFPATGAGRCPQVGTSKQPGPLYGVTADVWQALALALYIIEEGRYG